MSERDEEDRCTQTPPPILFVAEADALFCGERRISFRPVRSRKGRNSNPPGKASVHLDPCCLSKRPCNCLELPPGTPTTLPWISKCASEGSRELVGSIRCLSSYEDTVVLASSTSLHIFIRQAEGQTVDRSGTPVPQLNHQLEPLASCAAEAEYRPPPTIEFAFSNIAPQRKIVSVACGLNHILVATACGMVLALGSNSNGQLGDGSFVDKTKFVQVHIDLLFRAVSVHAGRDFSFAICRSSRFSSSRLICGAQGEPEKKRRSHESQPPKKGGDVVFAWGINEYGQLGGGVSFVGSCSCIPIQVESPLADAVYTDVECAAGYAVILTDEGLAVGFGLNTHGQLGNGSLTPKAAPEVIPLPYPLRSVSCSDCRVLALLRNGTVLSWGVEPTYQPPPKVRFPANLPQEGEGYCGSDCPATHHDNLLRSQIELHDAAETDESLCSEVDCTEMETKDFASGSTADPVPFFHSPGLHQVRGLPLGISNVATGVGLSCAVCISPQAASESQSVCIWHSSKGNRREAEVTTTIAARLPPVCVVHTKDGRYLSRKLEWFCRCSQQNVLIWARAEPEDSAPQNLPGS